MILEAFEGPWEEIQTQTHAFVGHRVRVTVLDSEQTTNPSLPGDTAVKAPLKRYRGV